MQEQNTPSEVRALQTSFLSLISHELRAPLQTVNGYLDLALSGMAGALNAEQAQFLKRARCGSIHLSAIVDDLLFLARAEGGLFRPASRPTSIGLLVQEALEEVTLLTEEPQITARIALPRILPPVAGDAQRLGQVIRNLLMEAIARAPERGGVRISAATPPSALILTIAVEQPSQGPSDTAIGRPAESDSSRHGAWLEEPITAQRLRVCRLIAEAHGGALTIASAPGGGPSFALRLPPIASQQPSVS